MNTELSKANVKHQLNYHIIPFAYGLSYDDAQSLLQGKCQRNEWKIADLGDENLLKHINNLISDKDNGVSTIGRRYVLEQKGMNLIGLQNNKDAIYIFISNKGKEYSIRINSIELYLFETQIGFAAVKFEYSEDMEDIIDINYSLKHLSIKGSKIYYRMKKSEVDKGTVKELHLADLVCNITSEIEIKTFFENNDNGKIHKSLVFNAVIMDKPLDGDSVKDYLYKMRRVFKDTYKPTTKELQLENNPEILQLFENVYWGASLEAMTCLVHFVEDQNTNEFFDNSYIKRLANSYLYLYLIILHMRYSLLYFSILSAELPKDINECIKLENSKDKNVISISKLEEKIAFFKLRCVFRDVSNITHQSNLYSMIWKVHNIENLLHELDSEINALAIRTNLRKQEEEKQAKAVEEKNKRDRDRKEEQFKDRMTIVTIFFTIISAIANVTKMSESIKSIFANPGRTPEFWIFIGILILIAVFFGLYVPHTKSKKRSYKK